MAKNGEGLGTLITSGGHKVDIRGRRLHSNNILDFIIQRSIVDKAPRCSHKIMSTGKKLALRYVFVVGHRSSRMSTLHSSAVIHVMCPLFFAALPL